MNYVDLPHMPGILRGFNLRIEAAKAISQVEMLERNGVNVGVEANALAHFFNACHEAVLDAQEPPQAPQPQGKGGKASK